MSPSVSRQFEEKFEISPVLLENSRCRSATSVSQKSTVMGHPTLYPHLADLEQQAQRMFDRLMDELSEKEGIMEKLKAENPMLWVQRTNNIRNSAMEIVNAELIYA